MHLCRNLKMTDLWRKIENESGFIFYLNEKTNLKQWDHPKFSELRQRIDECNYIKYSTYRVALKFRVLQQTLYMEDVQLSVIEGVFDRHRLGMNESSLCLETCDLEAVLSDIYFATNKKCHTNIDVDFATELMLNFLYNIYDTDRKGKVQVACTKLVLAILCNCSLKDLYKFISQLCSDHNNCVTRLRLQTMLTKLVDVTNFLHEDANFGNHLVNSTIENCFNNSPGLVGVSANNFISWIEKTPHLISWLPLLHRIKSAETVVHYVKCHTCKTTPIMGLRYKCMKCTRYTQCQRCFFTGRTSHSHKLSHSMREFTTQGNSNEFGYGYIKKLFGLLSCSSNLIDPNPSVIDTKPLSCEKTLDASEIVCNIEPLSSPQLQLQMIINQLEMQNRELHQMLQLGNCTDKEIKCYLEDHRIHVSAQIQKLKILMDCLRVPPPATPQNVNKKMTESTPMVFNDRVAPRNLSLDLLSPIAQIPEEETAKSVTSAGSTSYNIDDISTWIGGRPDISNCKMPSMPEPRSCIVNTPARAFHNDLDEALAKLQQILANNFSLDESISQVENSGLKSTVDEVEDILTNFIDTVETSRTNSVQNLIKQ